MAESESVLTSHAVSRTGSTDPRVKPTQFLSGDFLLQMLESLARRGDNALSAWFGPDSPRGYVDSLIPVLPGFIFQDNFVIDTTTTPGAINLVEDFTPRPYYGDISGRFTGMVTSREGAGSIDQAQTYFDLVIGEQVGVNDIPVGDATGATTYTILLAMSTIPKTVTPNPRTSVYEYTEEETVLGVAMIPDEVNDLGGGTIELVFPDTGLDTLWIATDSMAGRTATAWLADGPLDVQANAIVTGTITFSGGRNRLQIPDLGQGTVSTTPADYRVIVRGLCVTDYTFSPDFSGGVAVDMKGGILLGVAHLGSPDTNIFFAAQALTFASLASVVVESSGRNSTALLKNFLKLNVSQFDDEDVPNKAQISIKPRTTNAKYAGSTAYFINEEGEHNHVTTQTDFAYVTDDSGAAGTAAQRQFRKYVTPAHVRHPLIAGSSTAPESDLAVSEDGTNGRHWSCSDADDDLVFYLPLNVGGGIIEEIEIEFARGDGGAEASVRIGTLSKTQSAFAPLTSALDTSGVPSVGNQVIVFTAPADFTAIPLGLDYDTTNRLDVGLTEVDGNFYVAEVTISNNSTTTNAMKVRAVGVRGRQLINWPIRN